MPLDTPDYPGLRRIELSAGVLSFLGITDPENAFDDDPATAATFPEQVPIAVAVALSHNGWIDSDIVVQPGETRIIYPSGTGNNGPAGGNRSVTPAGTIPKTVITDSNGPYGGWAAERLSGNTSAPDIPTGYGLVIDPRVEGTGASIIRPETGPGAFCPGDGPYAYTNNGSDPVRLYLQFNGLGNYYHEYTGSFTVLFSYPTRFVKVDWGFNAFVSLIRLRMSGMGAINAAITLESSLGGIEAGTPDQGPDVPIPYIPLPSDEWNGVGVDEIQIDPPVLARGVTFYPDLLNTAALPADVRESLTLNLLQVYLDTSLLGEEEMPNPTKTTTTWTQVGVKEMSIYPYNGITGPYDNTTIEAFFGLQSLDVGESSTTATVTGGETVFEIDAYETARVLKFKVSVQITSERALAILQGGTFIVNPASGGLGEVEYHAPDKGDEAPYFRFVGKSAKGDGAERIVLPKCKISGAISKNKNKDQVTTLEFEFNAYWDRTYVRQDGTVGGIREYLHGEKGEVAMHS